MRIPSRRNRAWLESWPASAWKFRLPYTVANTKRRSISVAGQFESKHALSVPRPRGGAAARFLGGQHFVSFLNEIEPLPQFQCFPRFVSTRSWPSIHAAFISLSHGSHICVLASFAEIREWYRDAMPAVCEFQPRRMEAGEQDSSVRGVLYFTVAQGPK